MVQSLLLGTFIKKEEETDNYYTCVAAGKKSRNVVYLVMMSHPVNALSSWIWKFWLAWLRGIDSLTLNMKTSLKITVTELALNPIPERDTVHLESFDATQALFTNFTSEVSAFHAIQFRVMLNHTINLSSPENSNFDWGEPLACLADWASKSVWCTLCWRRRNPTCPAAR